MPIKLLICDDSNMARKQLARCLPDDWDVEILFAEDGHHGLEQIHEHNPDLMFLDLNMPILDGYETLEEISVQNLDIPVIVVSGDIQPTAQEKVLSLGAVDFIKKPIDKDQLRQILINCNFYQQTNTDDSPSEVIESHKPDKLSSLTSHLILTDEKAFLDACQEVANVAMGQAGDLLARYLDVFINLPIPKVNEIELAELNMAMQFADQDQTVSSVCQGFIGADIAGEALLLFNDSSFKNIASLLKYRGIVDKSVELELLMDISNIIVGACLKGISEQINVIFSQSHPVVLGQHIKVPDLIKQNVKHWRKTLSIEINYEIKDESINCDLLLLFTEESIEPLRKRISYLVD